MLTKPIVIITLLHLLPLHINAQNLTPKADTLLISAQQPLSAQNLDLRKQVLDLSLELSKLPGKELKPHPSSSIFPGSVKANTPVVNKTIHIQHTQISDNYKILANKLTCSSSYTPIMYSTGLYASPGQVLKIKSPGGLKYKVQIQIGCHTDNLNIRDGATENWRRMPIITRNDTLKYEEQEVWSAFGGLIYICCAPETPSWKESFEIDGGVEAPYFVLGKSSVKEWEEILTKTGAPWGEIEANHIVISLPTDILKKVKNPSSVARAWDRIIETSMDLAQMPLPFYRKQRLVTDVQLNAGYMHSGYPVMAHHCPENGIYTANIISDSLKLITDRIDLWGLFHEIGHNMQNSDWLFEGTVESSVNLFTLYCFDKIAGGSNGANESISEAKTNEYMSDYFKDLPDFQKWQNNPFLALILYRQIQNKYGWDLYKKVFKKYIELPPSLQPKNESQKRNLFVLTLSECAGINFAPFFLTWGIPVSNSVVEKLENQYPEWIPEMYGLKESPKETQKFARFVANAKELGDSVYLYFNDKNYKKAVFFLDSFINLYILQSTKIQQKFDYIPSQLQLHKAIANSHLNNKEEAINDLRMAIKSGFKDYVQLIISDEFENIKSEKGFIAATDSLKQQYDKLMLLRETRYNAQKENIPKFYYQSSRSPELKKVRNYFKLDSIAGKGDEISRLKKLMTWVHQTVIIDGSVEFSDSLNSINLINKHIKNSKDASMKVAAIVLNEVYLAMGFNSRLVYCLPKDPNDFDYQVLSIVFSKKLKKWICMDPFINTYLSDKNNHLLDIREVREKIINNDVIFVNPEIQLNGKHFSPEKYLTYLTKNLYWFACPVRSQYNLTFRDNFPDEMIGLVPENNMPFNQNLMCKYYTNNPDIFWK